jgi:ribonuclease VapC
VIVDSSSLLAVVFREAGFELIRVKFEEANSRKISAVTLAEVSIVFRCRKGYENSRLLEELLSALRVEVIPFTESQALLAIDAHRRFGKGRHPAKLNLADCMAYALAIETGEPPLFTGNDFGQTDVLVA